MTNQATDQPEANQTISTSGSTTLLWCVVVFARVLGAALIATPFFAVCVIPVLLVGWWLLGAVLLSFVVCVACITLGCRLSFG